MIVDPRLQRIILPSILVLLLVAGWISFRHIAPLPSAAEAAKAGPNLSALSAQALQTGVVSQVTLIQDGIRTTADFIDAPNSGLVIEFQVRGLAEDIASGAIGACQYFHTALHETGVINVNRIDCILVLEDHKLRLSSNAFNKKTLIGGPRGFDYLKREIDGWVQTVRKSAHDL